MKKVLMILAGMLLMLSFGGCGPEGDNYSYEEISAITKEKVLSVAGIWSVSQGLSTTESLTLTDLE